LACLSSSPLLLLFLLIGRVFSIRRGPTLLALILSRCVVPLVVLDPEVVHDDNELAEEYCVVEVLLREHSHQTGHLHFLQVSHTQLFHSLQEPYGAQELQVLTLKLLLDDEGLEGLPNGYTRLHDCLCYSHKATLCDVEHFFFIDVVIILSILIIFILFLRSFLG
jgi:hypothetical protein